MIIHTGRVTNKNSMEAEQELIPGQHKNMHSHRIFRRLTNGVTPFPSPKVYHGTY